MDMRRGRVWYKYHFKTGNKIKHGGITKNLDRREREHRQAWPNGHIMQVGRQVTKRGALRWEKEHGFS
jgi:predicted GIY-YIG superfamily endonuclease